MSKAEAVEEARDGRGLLVGGIVATGMTGVFKWAWMDYNLVASSSVLGWEETYIASLLVCLSLIGSGLGSVRTGFLMIWRAGGITPEMEGALTDNVPNSISGIAALPLLVATYLVVFRPG